MPVSPNVVSVIRKSIISNGLKVVPKDVVRHSRKSSHHSRKSFNDLSLENPERDMMDMHYGRKHAPVQLYELKMTKQNTTNLMQDADLKSDNNSFNDVELYSM